MPSTVSAVRPGFIIVLYFRLRDLAAKLAAGILSVTGRNRPR
jgi:hypothetical protein